MKDYLENISTATILLGQLGDLIETNNHHQPAKIQIKWMKTLA